MYGGKTPAEMVAMMIDAKDKKSYDIVKNYWTAQWTGKDKEKEATWRKAVHDGILTGGKAPEADQGRLRHKRKFRSPRRRPAAVSKFRSC